jgi:hypothetical protein
MTTFDTIRSGAAVLIAATGLAAPARGQECTGTLAAFLTASDAQTDDFFGQDVDISGDFAIVGADGEDTIASASGGAYIYRRIGNSWVQETFLKPQDAQSSDAAGTGVAISGNVAVIGAPGEDDRGSAAGAAYVFQRVSGTWIQRAKLLASDGAASDDFGRQVAIEGDTIVIGAQGDDDRGSGSGAAYVFRGAGATWNQVGKIVPADGQAGDQFGVSVAISGGIIAVGANQDDDRGSNSGSAYVFIEPAPGTFLQQSKVTADDGAASDDFGVRVDIDGESMIVGARFNDDRDTDSGSAYVFVRIGGVAWVQQAKLVGSDVGLQDNFGRDIAIDGDTAFVSAENDDDDGAQSGSVYAYQRTGSAWAQVGKITVSDGTSTALFGNEIAYDGTRLIIGGPLDDTLSPLSASADSGAAAIYTLDCTGGDCQADLTGDGQIDSGDLQLFIQLFLAGSC